MLLKHSRRSLILCKVVIPSSILQYDSAGDRRWQRDFAANTARGLTGAQS